MKNKTDKTCIKYWGGKQQLVPKLLELIPQHYTYCEPFFGGGALFFAKNLSQNEVINDLNDNMINFYRILKRRFKELFEEVEITLYSEFQHKQAVKLWKEGMSEDEIKRAWAVFVLSHQSFSGILGSTWAFSRSKNEAIRWDNIKRNFDQRYSRRLERTQIFCRDALNVIELSDDPNTFFFIDPPYYNADMGHYKGYTEMDFKNLLNMLTKLQGKFLLTTYPSQILDDYTESNKWLTINNNMHLSAANKKGATKNEVFTMNYPRPIQQSILF